VHADKHAKEGRQQSPSTFTHRVLARVLHNQNCPSHVLLLFGCVVVLAGLLPVGLRLLVMKGGSWTCQAGSWFESQGSLRLYDYMTAAVPAHICTLFAAVTCSCHPFSCAWPAMALWRGQPEHHEHWLVCSFDHDRLHNCLV